MRTTHPWTTRLAAGTLMAVLLASAGFAQVRWGGGYRRSRVPPRYRPADHRDNGFAFCRLQYTSVLSEPAGRGWHTDYPNADTNFMIRLSELTSTKVDFGDRGDPNHWVVEITDPELFSCPFVMTSDVGTMGLNEEEVERLRAYFVKGGFLWVDDFWGTPAWNQRLSQIGRVLPQSEYPLIDLPLDHPVWSRNSCGLPVVELQESPEAFAASHRPGLADLLQGKEEEIALSLVIALGVEVLDIRAQRGP